jgi:hypothetical protein
LVASVAEVVAGNRALIEAPIAGDNRTTFSSSHIFVHLKAEDRHIAESADFLPIDACAIRLRAIFEQE